MNKLCLLMSLFFLSTLIGIAQKATVKVSLRNGDIVTGTYHMSKISVRTEYGKLEIPAEDVSQLKFGLTKNTSIASKVKKQLDILNTGDKESKEKAYNEIMEHGIDAIPVVEEYLSSPEYTNSLNVEDIDLEDNEDSNWYSPEQLLDDLYSSFSADASFADTDVVFLNEGYEVHGTTDVKNIKISTEYGNLDLPRNQILNMDIVEVESSSKGTGTERVFKLQASKHISGNKNGGWLRTGLRVKSGEIVQINSTGSVTLASLSNKTYYPNGKNNKSGSTTANYDDETYTNTSKQYPTYGMVVYKVGTNGTVQKAGSNFKGKVQGSGDLYISIYETVYNTKNKGSYTVTIRKK